MEVLKSQFLSVAKAKYNTDNIDHLSAEQKLVIAQSFMTSASLTLKDVPKLHDLFEKTDWKTLQSHPKLEAIGSDDDGYYDIGDREIYKGKLVVDLGDAYVLVSKSLDIDKLKSELKKKKEKKENLIDESFRDMLFFIPNMFIKGEGIPELINTGNLENFSKIRYKKRSYWCANGDINYVRFANEAIESGNYEIFNIKNGGVFMELGDDDTIRVPTNDVETIKKFLKIAGKKYNDIAKLVKVDNKPYSDLDKEYSDFMKEYDAKVKILDKERSDFIEKHDAKVEKFEEEVMKGNFTI